jgi:hypothetical protein
MVEALLGADRSVDLPSSSLKLSQSNMKSDPSGIGRE